LQNKSPGSVGVTLAASPTAETATRRRTNSNENTNLIPKTEPNTNTKDNSLLPKDAEIKIPGVGVTPVAVSTKLPAAVAQLTQQGDLLIYFLII